MKHAILGAIALACVFVAPANAGGLHPDCGVSMPCEITSVMPSLSNDRLKTREKAQKDRSDTGYSNVSGHYRVSAKHYEGGDKTAEKASSVYRHRNNINNLRETTGGDLIAKARAYIGQTARQVGVRATLWCSAFVRKITQATGVDDRARSWLGKPHVAPHVGAIAIVSRGRSAKNGHVGLVSGFTPSGDPILISGNHGGRVWESVYSARRVLAYVSPS